MPSPVEKRILEMIAQKGRETTYEEVREELREYGDKFVRRFLASLGRQDYIYWRASGKIELMDKGKQALGLRLKEWVVIPTDKFNF